MVDKVYVNGFEGLEVDGKRIITHQPRYQVEKDLLRKCGYTLIPKKSVKSVTKQDLIDHPEKFQPFKYARWTNFSWTYKFLIECHEMEYKNGKWRRRKKDGPMRKFACDPLESLTTEEAMSWDVAYMEQYYPELYKELLRQNGLPETYSQIKANNGESQDEPEESKKVEEINYTHIPESPDLEF